MATKSNQTRGAGSAPRKKLSAKQKEARKKKKIIVFGLEILVLLVMVGVLYKVYASESNKTPINILDLSEYEKSDLGIAQEAAENNDLQGYWNIALFGVDAMTSNELFKGSRTDSLMIASINRETGDIKLVSVYRDTYLNIGNDSYRKCNNAYFSGGADQAIKMLNMNLDLDISDFVTVGYGGLSSVIDGLGGIWIDVNSEELKHINNYQISIAEVLKCDYKRVENAGYQLLDGLQATAYCRIRYTAGNDYRRAQRQREVLMAIEEQAKKASLATLTKTFDKAAGSIYTSLKPEDILDLLGKIGNYRIVDEAGFPQDDMRTDGSFGSKGSLVVPVSLESNVVWLHEFLFGSTEYTVSERVKEYSSVIRADTSPYLQ